ncbi:MAG: hypothetical protein EAZ07_01410 [Cytophagales bacterium]|nr:MAG: hypothetical protein EAZ07_01410 [Cytophagales bacterium]
MGALKNMQNKDTVTSVKIRAFRAIEDLEASMKFVNGHRRLLEAFGVKAVTSANIDWVYNPAVFVIIVESLDGEKIFGGSRVHAAGGTQPLPIEEATGKKDPKIYDMVNQLKEHGTGELCGLWNSREVAGLGIGAYFATRAGVTLSSMIGISSMFALCASYTVKFAMRVGCNIVTELGNNGTYYYPKEDLLATAVLLRDTIPLSLAVPEEREIMFDLRKKPVQTRFEINPLRKNELEIHYDLQIDSLNQDEFKHKFRQALNQSQ